MATASSSSVSLADKSFELIDPCPDIHALFMQFNDKFFYGALSRCEVRWSDPRMIRCAGKCHYKTREGYCSIRLSEPLLKLRTRKNLVETLLHEMLHAYLFVTNNYRNRCHHGPEFRKHMDRINAQTDVKVSVYHKFRDEVNEYKKHWWRCEGSCRARPPSYGWVRRAMNRAPSKNDLWWEQHEQTCGGKFIKVKEPEPQIKKPKDEKTKSASKGSPVRNKDPKQKAIEAFYGKGYVLGEGSSKSVNPETKENAKVQSSDNVVMVSCPSCMEFVSESSINLHLDGCLV